MPLSMLSATFENVLGAGAPQKSLFEMLLGRPPETWETAIQMVGLAAVFLGVISVVAMFCIWWERKVAGHIQCRPGPNRVGPIGILQSLADGLKLLVKEDLVPPFGDGLLFRIWRSHRCSRRFWRCRSGRIWMPRRD
jgi:hypothetical protein